MTTLRFILAAAILIGAGACSGGENQPVAPAPAPEGVVQPVVPADAGTTENTPPETPEDGMPDGEAGSQPHQGWRA